MGESGKDARTAFGQFRRRKQCSGRLVIARLAQQFTARAREALGQLYAGGVHRRTNWRRILQKKVKICKKNFFEPAPQRLETPRHRHRKAQEVPEWAAKRREYACRKWCAASASTTRRTRVGERKAKFEWSNWRQPKKCFGTNKKFHKKIFYAFLVVRQREFGVQKAHIDLHGARAALAEHAVNGIEEARDGGLEILNAEGGMVESLEQSKNPLLGIRPMAAARTERSAR